MATGTSPEAPPARFRLSRPAHLLACGFGAGLAPRAPGTVGTLVGVLGYLALAALALPLYLAVCATAFALGVWICAATARDLGVHDHPGIVWDEIVGYLLTMAGAPGGWPWMVAGFLLFRLFDIVKPWPIGLVDRRVRGGLGIMLDDALAAALAWVCLQLAARSLGIR